MSRTASDVGESRRVSPRVTRSADGRQVEALTWWEGGPNRAAGSQRAQIRWDPAGPRRRGGQRRGPVVPVQEPRVQQVWAAGEEGLDVRVGAPDDVPGHHLDPGPGERGVVLL